jgi:hypothetical protein
MPSFASKDEYAIADKDIFYANTKRNICLEHLTGFNMIS